MNLKPMRRAVLLTHGTPPPVLANAGFAGFKTDEQRKAVMARFRGGGGGGGGGGGWGRIKAGWQSIKQHASEMGRTPDPVKYLDQLQSDQAGRDAFVRTALSFTPAGPALAIEDMVHARTPSAVALASLGAIPAPGPIDDLAFRTLQRSRPLAARRLGSQMVRDAIAADKDALRAGILKPQPVRDLAATAPGNLVDKAWDLQVTKLGQKLGLDDADIQNPKTRAALDQIMEDIDTKWYTPSGQARAREAAQQAGIVKPQPVRDLAATTPSPEAIQRHRTVSRYDFDSDEPDYYRHFYYGGQKRPAPLSDAQLAHAMASGNLRPPPQSVRELRAALYDAQARRDKEAVRNITDRLIDADGLQNRAPLPDRQRRAMFARQRMSGAPPAPREAAPPATATTRALAAAVAAVRAGETVDRESNTSSRKIPTQPREKPTYNPQRPGRLLPGPGYIDHDAWRQGADKRGLPISAPSRR